MIEFRGTLTGSAEKRFWVKTAIFAGVLFLVGGIACFPVILSVSLGLRSFVFFGIYGLAFGTAMLLLVLPKTKKQKANMLPSRIWLDEDYIYCQSKTYLEQKGIDDVKRVYKYADFYELCFPFGNISEKFICQKSLLTQGTLEEFESLFQGKIIEK